MRKFIVLFFLVPLFFSGCEKPFYCNEVRGLDGSSLNISLFHTGMGNYFYPVDEFRSPYKRDSLQVFNEDGRKFELVNFGLELDPRNHLNSFYGVKISPAFMIPGDEEAYNSEKTRKIFLKYNYNTIDTLNLVFKAYKNNCDKGIYEYLKIYHRGNLVTSVSNDIYAYFQLNH